MRSFPGHRSVELIGLAAEKASPRLGMISFSDHMGPRFGRLPLPLRNLLNPWLLGRTARRRPGRALLVREFLALPLLLAWPGLWRLRRRLVFVVNHNVQTAHTSRRGRFALELLLRLGFRFACLESALGLERLGIPFAAEQVVVLPLGIPDDSEPPKRHRPERRPVLGLVGNVRAEKGGAELMDYLASAASTFAGGVLVGTPSEAARARAREIGWTAVDTTQRDTYLAVLRDVDVLLLNYRRDRYYYRPSSAILDAMAAGTPVVCPDYPVLRTQLTVPSRVGATFEHLHDIPKAVQVALATTHEAFVEQIRYRGSESLGRLVAEQLLETDGGRR